jgi:hypothetical protein
MVQAESPVAPRPPIDAAIQASLARLRRRIRLYVLLQGFAALVLWLGLTFWVGFAIDYLPVLLGASEMPRVARAIFLGSVAIGAAYVTYRWLLARLWVPLEDRSMALLLERQQTSFHDSLVTIVELADGRVAEERLTQEMLAETGRKAVKELQATRLTRVFNFRPLLRALGFATLLIASIAGAYVLNPAAMTQAAQRLYALDDTLWERFAHIEVVGVEVRRATDDASASAPLTLSFVDGRLKVARGSNVTLRVHADANAALLPEQCFLLYRTEEGDRGTVTLKRVGRPRDGHQLYICDAKPLAGILSSLEFEVLGYDHRLSGFYLDVVESPVIVGAAMDLVYPSYMVDEQNAIHLPRQGEPVMPSGNAIPYGTQATLQLTSSKPLLAVDVRVLDPEAAEASQLEVERKQLTFAADEGRREFAYELPSFSSSRTVEVSLRDTDGVTSERAYRAFFTAIPDEAPRWELTLQGIGAAITPDAIIPVQGKVTDDYGVAAVGLDTVLGEAPPIRFEVPLTRGSEFRHAIDFRLERSQREGFEVKPGDKVSLVGYAVDRFNLGAAPNSGLSERYVLDVVTPDQLLVALEARELALRRRFEVILEELTAMRDSLLRIKPGEIAPTAAVDPEAAEPGEAKMSPAELARREVELRQLRVQRAFQQSRKSSQEIQGVAQGFNIIREELINNRMDTEDRKSRLKEQIADPLHALVQNDFAALEAQLLDLEPLLEDAARGTPALEAAVRRSNELLAKLDQVLQKMLKLESYNEIVDLVRDLIQEQHSLLDDTKRQQRRDLEE